MILIGYKWYIWTLQVKMAYVLLCLLLIFILETWYMKFMQEAWLRPEGCPEWYLEGHSAVCLISIICFYYYRFIIEDNVKFQLEMSESDDVIFVFFLPKVSGFKIAILSKHTDVLRQIRAVITKGLLPVVLLKCHEIYVKSYAKWTEYLTRYKIICLNDFILRDKE